jgi:hypothetical protein
MTEIIVRTCRLLAKKALCRYKWWGIRQGLKIYLQFNSTTKSDVWNKFLALGDEGVPYCPEVACNIQVDMRIWLEQRGIDTVQCKHLPDLNRLHRRAAISGRSWMGHWVAFGSRHLERTLVSVICFLSFKWPIRNCDAEKEEKIVRSDFMLRIDTFPTYFFSAEWISQNMWLRAPLPNIGACDRRGNPGYRNRFIDTQTNIPFFITTTQSHVLEIQRTITYR